MHVEFTEEQEALRKVVARLRRGARSRPHAEAWDRDHHFPVDVVRADGRARPVRPPVPRGVRRRRAATSPRCASPSRSWPGSTSRWPSPSRPASASAPTRSTGSAPRSSGSAGCPTSAPAARSAASASPSPRRAATPAAPAPRAVLDEATGEWVINGEKAFITNSGTDDHVGRHGHRPHRARRDQRRSSCRPARPGFEVQPPYRKMGWHASDTHGLTFTDCRVPEANLLGERGRGFAQFLADPRRGPGRHRRPRGRVHPGLPRALRASTPRSATRSASRSAPTRPWPSRWPTWP